MLLPRANDAAAGPVYEENMALIETIIGKNGPAILAFTQLLQTAYSSWYYGPAPITPALLRLDPRPFAHRPRFPKTLREKAAMKYRDFFAETKTAQHLRSRFPFLFGCLIVITNL
jgi:hypothetical protein